MTELLNHVLRAREFGQTRRYHTQVMLKEQDVAQHSFGVAWLVYYLTDGRPGEVLLLAALSHDAGERWTGDMPSPVKRAIGAGPALDGLEANALAAAGYRQAYLTPLQQETLKVADLLDGCFYSLRELELGNRLVAQTAANGGMESGSLVNFTLYTAGKLSELMSAPTYEMAVKGRTLLNYITERADELSK